MFCKTQLFQKVRLARTPTCIDFTNDFTSYWLSTRCAKQI